MADRYWVGGTASWNATAGTKWATSTGGAGGAAVPTAADDVYFDAASGAVTVTLGTSMSCRSINCTGFTGTLSHSASVTISIGDGTAGAGNVALTLVAGMTYTLGSATTSALSFLSTSATQQTVTWGGKTPGNVTFNGAGGSWKIQDAWSASTTTVTLTAGTLDTNGQTCTWGTFSSNTVNARTLTLGASSLTLAAASQCWLLQGGAPVLNAGTSTITCSGPLVSFTAATGQAYNNLVFAGSGTVSFANRGSTYVNLTRTGTANKTDGLSIFDSGLTVSGAFTVTSNSDTNRVLVQSSVVGSPRTITARSVVFGSTVDFQDIAAAGAATWTPGASGATGLGDCGGNSGITFTAAATQTHTASAGGNWSDATKWTSRVPLPQDPVVVDGNTTGTLTVDMPRLGKDLTFTGFAGALTATSTAMTLYGSLAWAVGMTITINQVLTFAGRGSHTITSSGKTVSNTFFTGAGGTYTLLDAFTAAANGGITFNNGTLDANGFNVSTGSFLSASGLTRSLVMGAGTWTITGTTGALWNVQTAGLTFSGGSATIVFAAVSTASRSFAGAGLSYGTLTYTVASSPGPLVLTGANTFATLNVGSGRTVTLPSSTTTTITGAFTVAGAANGYLYLPAVAGNYASAPDSSPLSITGDLDIRVRLAHDSWVPATLQYAVAKYNDVNGGRSYLLGITATGALRFWASGDGSALLGSPTSSATTGFSAGQVAWIRVTRTTADGVIKFYTSTTNTNDPTAVTWTQLGTNQASTAGSLFDSTATLNVGSSTDGTAGPLAAKVYRAAIYSTIGGATPAFDSDFTTKAVAANTFTESSSNAATVTINGTLAQVGDGRVSIASSSAGTAATLTKSSGNVVCDYLTVQDSTATGGAGWYAGSHSTSISGNTGWVFSDFSAVSSAETLTWTGDQAVQLGVAQSDTLTLAGSEAIAAASTTTDALANSDVAQVAAAAPVTDDVSLADANAAPSLLATASDAFALADTESAAAALAGAEIVGVVDAVAQLAAATSVTDDVSLTDATSVSPSVLADDDLTVLDAGIAVPAVGDTDAVGLGDEATLTAGIAGTEAFIVTDTQVTLAHAVSADALALLEAGGLLSLVASGDVLATGDTATLAATLAGADLVSLLQSGTLRAFIVTPDGIDMLDAATAAVVIGLVGVQITQRVFFVEDVQTITFEEHTGITEQG